MNAALLTPLSRTVFFRGLKDLDDRFHDDRFQVWAFVDEPVSWGIPRDAPESSSWKDPEVWSK